MLLERCSQADPAIVAGEALEATGVLEWVAKHLVHDAAQFIGFVIPGFDPHFPVHQAADSRLPIRLQCFVRPLGRDWAPAPTAFAAKSTPLGPEALTGLNPSRPFEIQQNLLFSSAYRVLSREAARALI